MADYLTDKGTIITEAMIDAWAEQADTAFHGAPVTITAVEGRPWETATAPMRPRTIRLPDALWGLVEAKAKRRHLTVSEYTRQALAEDLVKA